MSNQSAAASSRRRNQCQKPTGWFGRFVLWNMNSHHSRVTDWGLSHISVKAQGIILDVGCGGGRTVSKLAAMASGGKVYGIDHSPASVTFARKINQAGVAAGQVEIQEASVSQLPFPDDLFDLATAIETHFWWPDLPTGMREVLRVLKPGGTLMLIAEVYKKANTAMGKLVDAYAHLTGLKLLDLDEHRELFTNAGYYDVQVIAEPGNGWICAMGRKPATQKP